MTDKARILFVDDEQMLLDAFRRSFKRRKGEQWDMTFETDPKKALLAHKENPFQVIVTDFLMPGMNGIDLANQIHEMDETTQVVMLTGAADLQTAAHVINATKVFRFYTKPSQNDDLEMGIEECLRRYDEKVNERKPAPQYGTTVLDRLPVGVIICEKNGHVVHMNRYGMELCARRDPLVVDSANILRPVSASHRDQFSNSLSQPFSKDRALTLSSSHSDQPLSIIMSGFGHEDDGKVVLLISDPERHVAPSIDILQSIYDLPPSEARLLHLMVKGFSLQRAAEEMDITESSARTYLKRIFSKTNTSGQPELIRTVLLTPAFQPSASA